MTTIAPRIFHSHEPVGERVSHAVMAHDGRQPNVWMVPGVPEFRDEMDRFYANDLDPELSPTEYTALREQLTLLRESAMRGTVRLSGFRPDGKVIDRTHFVIELRPQIRGRAFGRQLRELRLYFAEPAVLPRGLLALKLATKESSDAGYAEQDDAIDEAQGRAFDWQAR